MFPVTRRLTAVSVAGAAALATALVATPVAAAHSVDEYVTIASPWPGPDRTIRVQAIPLCSATDGTESLLVTTEDPDWQGFVNHGWGAWLRDVTVFYTATSISWRNADTGAAGGTLGHGANGSSESQEHMLTGAGRVTVDVDIRIGIPGGYEFGSLGSRTASTGLEVTVPDCG